MNVLLIIRNNNIKKEKIILSQISQQTKERKLGRKQIYRQGNLRSLITSEKRKKTGKKRERKEKVICYLESRYNQSGKK